MRTLRLSKFHVLLIVFPLLIKKLHTAYLLPARAWASSLYTVVSKMEMVPALRQCIVSERKPTQDQIPHKGTESQPVVRASRAEVGYA